MNALLAKFIHSTWNYILPSIFIAKYWPLDMRIVHISICFGLKYINSVLSQLISDSKEGIYEQLKAQVTIVLVTICSDLLSQHQMRFFHLHPENIYIHAWWMYRIWICALWWIHCCDHSFKPHLESTSSLLLWKTVFSSVICISKMM